MKKVWSMFANLFGLNKNSKYVKNYLNEANMRSGIYMSFVIFALELWLLIRQTDKYIIPTLSSPDNTYSIFRVIFVNTSNFWLMLSFGLAMFFYCIFYADKKHSKTTLILTLVFAGISLIFVALMPFEFIYTSSFRTVPLIFLIIFYSSVFLFDVVVILASIYKYRGGNNPVITSVIIISLFALTCLVFGVKVSYSDFASMKKINGELVNNPDYKQIICFLMMTLYVGCLLIWRPYISVGILGVVFLGFYILLDRTVSNRAFPEGDQVNYITFFISLTMVCISIYDQRVSEAKKDEKLEALATKDVLTNLWSYPYFVTLVNEKLKDPVVKLNEWIFLFFDITSFKIINDQKGFLEGNRILQEVGKLLTEYFDDGFVSRQADDHFFVFTKNIDIENKLSFIKEKVKQLDLDVKPGINVGGYILRDLNEDSRESAEKARYACGEIKNKIGYYSVYDAEMHDNYRLIQYVVSHIDEAIENGYIRPYYQPVVWSKGRKLCGAEALARWIDPKYGFLSPGKFVPALENSQLIYKLDIAILKMVCQQIKDTLNGEGFSLPVSINFSRIDFKVVDIVSIIDETVTTIGIPKNLLHVEITESALNNDEDSLKDAIHRLHELGYAVWLDDFGSGYSSFNVLKDFEFDVLKLDMAFLSGFENNQKSKFLIQSVIAMADQIGMLTLSEGVETKEEASFLEEIHCGRLQGFLYGKPLKYDELKQKIQSGELVISKELITHRK